MTCCAIIPIKALDQCKTRLRGALSEERRRSLVGEMLNHVVRTAEAAGSIDKVFLLSPPQDALPPHIPVLADNGLGLNAALEAAVQMIDPDMTRVVILAADLPNVTSADIETLAGVAPNAVAIGPDRRGSGTNALSLPLPAGRCFAFRFGLDSFALHCAEAARHTLPLCILRLEGLALDIDDPDDLAMLRDPEHFAI